MCPLVSDGVAGSETGVQMDVGFGTQLFMKPAECQSQLTYPVVKNTKTEKHRETTSTARGEGKPEKESQRRFSRQDKTN